MTTGRAELMGGWGSGAKGVCAMPLDPVTLRQVSMLETPVPKFTVRLSTSEWLRIAKE